jgi:GT2 family glycosyltransferase
LPPLPRRTSPFISVAIPVRDEGTRIAETVRSIAAARTGPTELEFVLVDDASSDSCTDDLDRVVGTLDRARLVLVRSESRLGVPRARNVAARHATGDVLFITDAHVKLSEGWDEHVLQHAAPDRILATTVGDGAGFAATGCVLAFPFMGTYWNRVKTRPLDPVQVAACPGTVITRSLFDRLGGYDEGMLLYGAAEPEFSVRAWLSGAHVLALPQVQVEHRFKPEEAKKEFLDELRPYMVHNAVRFAMLYLDDGVVLQTVCLQSTFGEPAREGLRMVLESDVYERRDHLRSTLAHDFAWFAERLDVRDHAGRRAVAPATSVVRHPTRCATGAGDLPSAGARVDAAQGLLLLGMHRSGTSAATRLVNLLGLAVCDRRDLLLDPRGNEKGYWESISMVDFNDRLLAQMGRNWWCPPRSGAEYQLDAGRVTVPETEGREAFDRTHRAAPWVWKDPRICATLPYWRRALERPVAALVMFRNPLEVGDSLLRRSKMSVPLGVAMWERYNRLVLEHARGLPTLVARYDDLLADPHAWCDTIAGFLGECGLLDEARADSRLVDDWVDEGLRHSRRGRDEVLQEFASVVPLLDVLEDAVGSWQSFEPPDLAPERGWVEAELVALGAAQPEPVPSPIPLTVSCVLDALGAGATEVAAALEVGSAPFEERIVVTDRPEVVDEVALPARSRIVVVPPGTSTDAARYAGRQHARAGIVEFRRLGATPVGPWAREARRAFAAGYAAVSPAAGPRDGQAALLPLDEPMGDFFAVEHGCLDGIGNQAGELGAGSVAAALRESGASWAEAAGVFELGGIVVPRTGSSAPA